MLGNTGLFKLLDLLLGGVLQHFVGGGIGVGSGSCVADADVKYGASSTLSEAMHKEVFP